MIQLHKDGKFTDYNMARKFYKEDIQTLPSIRFELSAPNGHSLVTDFNELEELHAERYEHNREEGVNYYNHFQARLYIDITTGTYTVFEVVALEAHLEKVSNEIKAGSWLTAQNTIMGVALSGIFDQSMKDSIKSDIDSYINENY